MGDAVWDTRAPYRSHPPQSQPLPAAPRVLRETPLLGGYDIGVVNRVVGYWANASIGASGIQIFLPTASGAVHFFTVADGQGTHHGPRVPYPGGEGWSWDRAGFIYLLDGPYLRRVHPEVDPVGEILFDVRTRVPDGWLWQAHSTDDGLLHSATVQTPAGRVGTILMARGREVAYVPALGVLDESLLTPDGAFLIILEDDDNRIITLESGEERRITQVEGAVGHGACTPSWLVGEDDQHGACVVWDLLSLTRRTLFSTWNMGHLSLRNGRCLLSDQTHLSWVDLTTGAVTPILAHGMISDGTYDTQVQASLDPTGSVAVYCSNKSGRLEAYCLELP